MSENVEKKCIKCGKKILLANLYGENICLSCKYSVEPEPSNEPKIKPKVVLSELDIAKEELRKEFRRLENSFHKHIDEVIDSKTKSLEKKMMNISIPRIRANMEKVLNDVLEKMEQAEKRRRRKNQIENEDYNYEVMKKEVIGDDEE
jgi:DNA-directed RNA polymerase subunit RPC12/RpoP